MTGYEAHELFNRFAPSLIVQTKRVPLFWPQSAVETQVLFSQHCEKPKRMLRRPLCVRKCSTPCLLCVRGNAATRFTDDLSNSECGYQFGVGKMGKYFGRGPMIGRRPHKPMLL